MKHAALILAKDGSTGLPGKNLLHLGGQGLLETTVSQLRCTGRFEVILLSTNSRELAERGQACGIELLMRPNELAANDRYVDAVNHAVSYLISSKNYTHFTIAQIVQPLRRNNLIEDILDAHGAGIDSVVTVTKFDSSINWIFRSSDYKTLMKPKEVLSGGPIGRENNLFEIDNNIVSFSRQSWDRASSITPWPYLGKNIRYIENNFLNKNFKIDINIDDDLEWAQFLQTFQDWREGNV